jgi:hypothetical protein
VFGHFQELHLSAAQELRFIPKELHFIHNNHGGEQFQQKNGQNHAKSVPFNKIMGTT